MSGWCEDQASRVLGPGDAQIKEDGVWSGARQPCSELVSSMEFKEKQLSLHPWEELGSNSPPEAEAPEEEG